MRYCQTEILSHADRNFPEQHNISHAAISRAEKVLAGISKRDRFPERTLNNSSLQRSDEDSGVTHTSWYEILLHQKKVV